MTDKQKWLLSLYSGLLFLLVASPYIYKATNYLTEMVGWSSSVNGCPNITGLLLHGVVFILLLRGIMAIPEEKK